MVTGQFEYVHNVRVPGMLHGRVVRPPAVGATLVSVDESSVSGMPGVVKVVVKKNFVGVVAEKPWQAIQAAGKLKVDVDAGQPACRASATSTTTCAIRNRRATRCSSTRRTWTRSSARAAKVVKATYLYPYQMHGSIGSACAVADVQGGKATIWSATQAVYPLKKQRRRCCSACRRRTCASSSGWAPAATAQRRRHGVVRRRAAVAGRRQAGARAADAQGRDGVGELRLRLRHRPARRRSTPTARSSPGITKRGRRRWAAGPAPNNPGNVVTGLLAGFEPAAFAPRSPAPDPTGFANNSNAVPSYVTGCVGGRCGGTGTVASERVLTHNVQSSFFTGPLRSPERLQNTFAHESFMDEIAAAVKADPVAYRLRHLSDPRLIDVVKAAAKAANWETRPSPRPGRPRGRASPVGRGISCVLYEGDNGYCAMVAEVDVESGHRPGHGQAAGHRQRLRADLEPGRLEESARRRRAAGHEPRAAAKK